MKRIFPKRLAPGLRLKAADLPGFAEGLLVIAVGASLAQLTWLLLPAPADRPVAAPTGSNAPAMASGPQLESVATLHLFGNATVAAPPPPTEAQAHAPETALNLTLRGVFAATRKESAFAIIAEGNGNERTLRIGDKVAGGAVLEDVLADRVVLQRDGRFETLRLPKELLDLNPSAAPPPSTAAPLSPAQTNRLRGLRDTLQHHPQEILRMADLRPVVEKGQLKGYRVEPKQYQDIFRAAGLRPDDIITAVNGIPVTDPGQLGALTAQLSSASSLTLDVERPGGVRDHVVINLN